MAGAAADGPADHVVADALAGLAGLILLGLAAAWAQPDWGPLAGREINGRDSQLPARTDAQLGEDLSEMPLDRARTEEESSADLCVGQAVAGEPRYVELLEGQLLEGLDTPSGRLVTDQGEFSPGSFGERGYPHRGQHVVSGAQLFPGLYALAGAAQPLAVQEVASGQLQAKPRSVQVLDRLAVCSFCLFTTQHRPEPGFDS